MKIVFCANCLHSFQVERHNPTQSYLCSIRCSIEYHTGMRQEPPDEDWSKVTVAEATAQQELKFE
jgi:hypothetical protein